MVILEPEVADIQLVSFFHQGWCGDFLAVEVGAVCGFEVNDDKAGVCGDNFCVAFADISIGQHDVIASRATNRDLLAKFNGFLEL